MNYKKTQKTNDSGCMDLTAYEAIEHISKEEQAEIRLKKLLAKIFKACDRYGFILEGRIVLKDKRTGKEYK